MKKVISCVIIGLVLGVIAFGGYMVFCPEKPEVSSYLIETVEKEDGVWCVKVTGLKNKLVQYKLNRIIRENWLLWLEDYLEDYPSASAEIIDGYIVSDSFLCLTNRLDSVVNGGSEPEYYAIYNLKTGELVSLDDLFELNDDFVKTLKQYGKTWQYDSGESMWRISGFEDDSEEEIRDYLERIVMSQSDYNKLVEGTNGKSYYKPDFTISEDYLYLRVRIPLDELEGFLKVPKWWESKPGLENKDLKEVNSEIEMYLNMTAQEIVALTGKEKEKYGSTFVFRTEVLYSCIRPDDFPFYFVCGESYEELPRYIAFYEEAEKEYMKMLGINDDMGFDEIIEVMEAESVVWESTERVDEFERERHKIEFEKYGLQYSFCSDNAEGYNFCMFIGRISQNP